MFEHRPQCVKSKKTGRKFYVGFEFKGTTGRMYYRLYEVGTNVEFEMPQDEVEEITREEAEA